MKQKLLLFFTMCFASVFAQSDYESYENLSKNLKILSASNKLVTVASIGKSSGGKDIWAVTLSKSKQAKPALLIVAGIDGSYQVGTQISYQMIASLLKSNQFLNLLEEKTVYIIPTVNPDAMVSFFDKNQKLKSGNNTKSDDDRDGKFGEDTSEDLNNDGFITQLRIEDVTGSYLESTEDTRVLVKADASKNQIGKYILISEGFDTDKDGSFNEDGSDGVNIDKNFTFDYAPFEKGAGTYIASESETRAVLDFLYANTNIHTVLTFGMHNNLSETPKFDSKNASTRIVKSWLENDVKAAENVTKLYTVKNEIKNTPKLPMTKGNFSQTAYYHAGKFSFSTPGWWVPKVEIAKDSTETKPSKGKKEEDKESNTDVAYLKWADSQNLNNVFVSWTTIKHADFPNKNVQVGGFKPYVINNPPLKFLSESITKHSNFVVSLLDAMPKLEVSLPIVEKVNTNLYRVTINIANKGLMPTYAEIGDKVRFTSRIKTEIVLNKSQSLVSGRKISFRNTLQPDESQEYSWLISGLGKITLTTGCATTGVKEINVDLK